MSRPIFGILVLLGATTPLAAQSHIVRGLVKDTQGALVPNVEITLESPRRTVTSDDKGFFVLDDVPAGKRRLNVRRIGYLAVNPTVIVPQLEGDTLQIILMQLPQRLEAIDVVVERKGIYGVVGDSSYRALPGTLVEVLGAGIADTTDSTGRFAFENLKERHYVLRFSRVGFYGRMISVDHNNTGREFSIFLAPYTPGSFDWANSREAGNALPELATRLAFEPKRYRMTREELTRYGSMALCDIARIRSQTYPRGRSTMGEEPNIILRGSTWWRNATLCGWNADQIDLVEWGIDPCKEAAKSIADILGIYCGPQRNPSLYATTPGLRKPFVVIWPRL